MSKKLICLLVFISFFCRAKSQLTIDGAVFYIGSGTSVVVQGNVTSNTDIQGPGTLVLKGTTVQDLDMSGHRIPNLEIDNGNNANLLSSATIGNNLLFTNGKLQINAFDLSIADLASISGASATRFVITNGTGTLKKKTLSAGSFSFPVGFSGSEFNPLLVSNNGTPDDIAVRCLQNVLDQGISGNPVLQDFANNSWVVTEAVPGGSNLTLSGEWVTADELNGFNRVKSGIAKYNSGSDWDLPASNVQAASGSNPYNRSRSNITSTGVFAVADLEKVNAAKLNLKVFLQGAYNATTGLMGDGLRTNNVLPTTQPYSAAMSATRFNRVGVYDGSATVNEAVPAVAAFDAGNNNDDVVDWIYVSLLDAAVPTTKLQTRAGLLQRDGDVVEFDAVSGTYQPLRMPIDSNGSYHLLVSHRNHLSARTAIPLLLQDNNTATYNFTDAQSKAYQNAAILTNTALASVTGAFPAFVLWAGNVNANSNVRYTGPTPDHLTLLSLLGGNTTTVLTPVYNLADLNLNGTVRYTGPTPDHLVLLNVLGGNTTNVITEHQ